MIITLSLSLSVLRTNLISFHQYQHLCVACIRRNFIGPCQVQQRRRSRAQIHHEGDSRVHPDHAGSACVLRTLSPFPQKQVTRKPVVWASPPHQSKLGKAPSRPLLGHTPPLAKMQIETRLGGNHTSASDSRLEAIDWARGGCGDHFGLFRASVRGRAAELRARQGAVIFTFFHILRYNHPSLTP